MTRRQMIERSMLTANSDIQLGCTAEEFDNVTIRGLGKPFGGGLNPPDYDTIPQGATTRNHQYETFHCAVELIT